MLQIFDIVHSDAEYLADVITYKRSTSNAAYVAAFCRAYLSSCGPTTSR